MDFISEHFLLFCLCIASASAQCFYTGSCYTSYDNGVSYRGNVALSRSGKNCVAWNRHLHSYTPDHYRFEGLDSNVCRNPLGKRDAPWCYTSPEGKEEESWELCDVQKCDTCLFRGVQLKRGDKFHDGCSLCVCQEEGVKCLECIGGPKFTNEIGCYIKYQNSELFPRCCPRTVCHGKDKDFVLDEYFDYLKIVLRAHQFPESSDSSATNSTHKL